MTEGHRRTSTTTAEHFQRDVMFDRNERKSSNRTTSRQHHRQRR